MLKNLIEFEHIFCYRSVRSKILTDSNSILKLLDKIQQTAIDHLLKIIKVEEDKYQKIHGRADINFYGFSRGPTVDVQGVKEVVQKIWIGKEDSLELITINNEDDRYVLKKDSFCLLSSKKQFTLRIENNDSSSDITMAQIIKTIIPLYELGTCPNGNDRMILIIESKVSDREKIAISYINTYLEAIKLKKSDEDLIRALVILIRDLTQIHLYNDGNGRALYLLANFLLVQSGLKPFYPRNMCMFDCNSIDKMIKEIREGQDRFAKMFGNFEELTKGLKSYNEFVLKLNELIDTNFPKSKALKKSFVERDVNLMLRQFAADPKTFPLLEFLISNAKILNVDIHAKGVTSGTALDVANKKKNLKAVELLRNIK